MRIKEISQKYGISRKALLVYEEKNLIHPKRDRSGYRQYDERDIQVIGKIVLLRKLDFSLDEISDLMMNQDNDFISKKKEQYNQDIQLIEIKKSYLEYVDQVLHDEYPIDEAVEAIDETLQLPTDSSYCSAKDYLQTSLVLWLGSLVIAVFSKSKYSIVGSFGLGFIALLMNTKPIRILLKHKIIKRIFGFGIVIVTCIGLVFIVKDEDSLINGILLLIGVLIFLFGTDLLSK